MAIKFLLRFSGLAAVALALSVIAVAVLAQTPSPNIKNSKHNLSATGPGAVKSDPVASGGTDQLCIFCHTPHNATMVEETDAGGAVVALRGPLWNRRLSNETYTQYTSNSLQAIVGQPGGASKLCLSCHDGTLAVGTVNVLGKSRNHKVSGIGDTTMPAGDGADSGFTRNLGIDLRNDHPISFEYNDTLVSADGELRKPPYESVLGEGAAKKTHLVVGIRDSSNKPLLPLDHNGHVQCTTCHDPHLDTSKFLRLNRLQTSSPTGGHFDPSTDQICLACHDKLGESWANSAHALSTVADEIYEDAAAARREFQTGTRVWQAACLNCHDTHTVRGSRRLLREGIERGAASTRKGTGAGEYKLGWDGDPAEKSAIEETCYQCHTGTANKILRATGGTGTVPNIQSDFGKSYRMPVATADQGFKKGTGTTADRYSSTERHDIMDADFMETREQLGHGNHDNRHAECTDCHNPHRVIRNSKFYGLPTDGNAGKRTHDVGGRFGNIASGALRGTWGIEPTYPATLSTTWPNPPTGHDVKKGDPKKMTDTSRDAGYLTREYQLCFKCHSNYGGVVKGSGPALGHRGGTTSGTNDMLEYTDIAAEFAAEAKEYNGSSVASLHGTDQCENGNDATGAVCNPRQHTVTIGSNTRTYSGSGPYDTRSGSPQNNHRSWHPVMHPTGRTITERGGSDGNFRAPFNGTNLGIQTMHCSDCHAADGSWTRSTGPKAGTVQGPHGSDNPFLLRSDSAVENSGLWSTAVRPGSPGFCGNCHIGNPGGGSSGFGGGEAAHSLSEHNRSCMRCHIAVPHGWRNKAFLVNLNCVGEEGGKDEGVTCVNHSDRILDHAPYYVGARLRVATWQRSRSWGAGSCGNVGGGGTEWMTNNCN